MLAIVIPYYKLIFFEATLHSLAIQTDKRFKVFIGDDASPEHPLALLKKYEGKFDFKYKRFEENLGSISLVKQWERCIAMTTDEKWIMLLGDDDYLDKTVVESWNKNYDIFNKKVNIVRFATQVIVEKSKHELNTYEHPEFENITDFLNRRYTYQTRSSLSEYVFSRIVFKKYGFYDYPLAWHSDDYAWIEFSDNKPIYTINKSIVYIRISDLSISGKSDNLKLKSEATILFLKNIITKKINLFNENEKFKMLIDFEVEVRKNRKLSFKEWMLIIFTYFKMFKLIPFIKVVRRFFINFFK